MNNLNDCRVTVAGPDCSKNRLDRLITWLQASERRCKGSSNARIRKVSRRSKSELGLGQITEVINQRQLGSLPIEVLNCSELVVVAVAQNLGRRKTTSPRVIQR